MTQTFAVADQPRGCGKTRDEGGVYAEVGFSEFGSPLEAFLIDPIVKCDPDEWGLSPRMPLLVEDDGGVNVIDWIGKSFYPNPADFLEEVRKLGLSRKLELSHDQYMKLTDESRILIVIPDAYIEPEFLKKNAGYRLDMSFVHYDWEICPQHKHDHEDHEPCAGYLWNRTDDGAVDHAMYPNSRYCTRPMPSFNYDGAKSPDKFLDADPAVFAPGFVASFKIGRLAVVKSPGSDLADMKMKKLEGCNLRVDLVDM